MNWHLLSWYLLLGWAICCAGCYLALVFLPAVYAVLSR